MRGDLLVKVGRLDEARVEFERAASLTRNTRERDCRWSEHKELKQT
jgi:predicted RNA polymerase sigma factor